MERAKRPDQIKRNEKIPLLPEQTKIGPEAETGKNLEAFVEERIGEIERSSQEIIEQGKRRFEEVKGYYDLPQERIEEISNKGRFYEKLNSIAEQIKKLEASTKERIFRAVREEEMKSTETGPEPTETKQAVEKEQEPNEEQKEQVVEIIHEPNEEEISETSVESIHGIRERISNPEVRKIIEEREKELEELFNNTEREVEEINKELEALRDFREEITRGRIETTVKERINPEKLRLAVEEYRMKLELHKRCLDFLERRKRYERAIDPISGRRLREDQLREIRPEFLNPINIIENTAPDFIKKAREWRYRLDKKYRGEMDEVFDEIIRNLQQFFETVKKEQEAYRERVRNLEHRIKMIKLDIRSAKSIEKRSGCKKNWLALQREAEQLANNLQDTLHFIDTQYLAQYGETEDIRESAAKTTQKMIEELQNILNEIYSFDVESALRVAIGEELVVKQSDCAFTMRSFGLYAITNPEHLKQKFFALQEKIIAVAEKVNGPQLIENLKYYKLDDETLERYRVFEYKRARRATRDVFTHATTTVALERILADGKLKSFMKLKKEGKLKGIPTTGNYEGQIFFSRNDVGIHWSRTQKFNHDDWAFFAATGGDIFASKASLNADPDIHFNYEGGDTVMGFAVYDPDNPYYSELSIENLTLVLPETKKEYWEEIMRKNGRDEKWIQEHVIYLPPETYQKKFKKIPGEEVIELDIQKLEKFVREQVLEKVRKRSPYAKKLYVPIPTDPKKFGIFSQRWVDTGIEI
jgi:hypothetical protein